jgi:hypothetical protein
LDIACSDRPRLGANVCTYGHPLNSDFLLRHGIVSRVATTAELSAEQPRSIPAEIKSPADALWIETDAKMQPGNSGGPLLDEKWRAIGVNSFVSPKVDIGYASHIKYLKELADKSSDAPTPLKSPPEPASPAGLNPGASAAPAPKITISRDQIPKLFNAAVGFHWKPSKPADYQVLKNLALLLTLCKAQRDRPDLAGFADGLFGKIKQVEWNPDRIRAVNLYAVSEMGKPGQGAVFVGTMMGRGKDPAGKNVALAFQIPGLSDLLLVPVADDIKIAQGSRVLVWGLILPKTGTAQIAGKSEPQAVRLIQSQYLLPLPL